MPIGAAIVAISITARVPRNRYKKNPPANAAAGQNKLQISMWVNSKNNIDMIGPKR